MTDAKALTLALKGRWYGRYGLACCPAHGDRKPSLSLSNGTDGRLLLRCHTGCDFHDMIEVLRGLGMVEGAGFPPKLDAAELARREAEERAEVEKRSWVARRVWDDTSPVRGTLAEAYLRGRGITCPLPSSLRFAPSCWYSKTQRLPALVALVEGADGFGVHRTYLRHDGSGKAVVKDSKRMLGQVAGGAVRLVEPPQGTVWPLVVAEGLETALSLASGLLDHPATIWAALSTSGLVALRLPSQPGELIVAMDGDRPGREAGDTLARIAARLGWSVSLLPAPEGRDWNDVLQGRAAT